MPVDLDYLLIDKADSFAEKAHFEHTRSNLAKEPYINHLREVADLVKNSGGNIEEICAGLLHESVEDTETTLDDILINFGQGMAEIVQSLTDDEESNKLPILERKSLQAEHVKKASDSVKRVKLADQISNIRCVTDDPPIEWDEKKCADYIEGARRISVECFGVSGFLDEQFKEDYKKASLKYNLNLVSGLIPRQLAAESLCIEP